MRESTHARHTPASISPLGLPGCQFDTEMVYELALYDYMLNVFTAALNGRFEDPLSCSSSAAASHNSHYDKSSDTGRCTGLSLCYLGR